ncbi:MAG: tetratricopeptide repeat protein [Gammaproteobacteria bacterium]|nr:tetratricopeptide repeat protein [Gammaproteobacteria bacterium]
MDNRLYNTLKVVAVALALAWVGWAAYDNFSGDNPHAVGLEAGRKHFKDGNYARALQEFEAIVAIDSRHTEALDGVARSLMQLSRNDEAMTTFDTLIAQSPEREQTPDETRLLGASYANRGILNDRLGNYQAAIADYEQAAALEEELNEGPHWLIRFLRNQPEKQTTILQRAEYLRAQLALPEEERLLRVPEKDAEQLPYNQ